MKNRERVLAEKLLQINAIKLQPDMPFVWGSGWNSPIYNDNRRLLSYPDVRNHIKVEAARAILENFPEAEVVASVSTVAIPMGAIVADVLGIPFIFVRDTPKDHGLENQIEGNLRPGQHVVLFEDVVSTGGSSIKAAEAIRMAGAEVAGGVAVFNYEFPAAVKRLHDDNINMVSLTTFSRMTEAAAELDYVAAADLATLEEWRRDPANWIPEKL